MSNLAGVRDEFDMSRYPGDVMDVLGAGREVDAVKLAMAEGIRSGNELSDLIFFRRHPERRGRSISSGEPRFVPLSREWLDIHDGIVRPVLHETMEDEMAQVQPELGAAGASRQVIERPLVIGQIIAGERDPNKLTNQVFFLRHKDLQGRRIAPGETALKQEWLSIRRDIVQPALASIGLPPPRTSGPASVGAGTVADALRIAKREVPGMPGTTTEALVERWRSSICPEIPRAILLAFIKYESGGNFTDATHGSEKSGWTSPSFYELGLFQTPAGLHGRCTSRDWRSCEFRPPGREVPGDRSTWVRLCAAIKADPQQWTNPTTQVRVGLLDLEIGARGLRRDFPELFPKPGSDWDLRMAVLYRFSRGGGYARSFLRLYRRQLAAMPESQRWGFLREKTATGSGGATRAFSGENVEEKMALAAKLGYVASSGSAVALEESQTMDEV